MINQNEFFREATLRICSSLDIDQSLSKLFDYLETVIPVDSISLMTIDLDQAEIRTEAQVQREGSLLIEPGWPHKISITPNYIQKLCKRETEGDLALIANYPDDTQEGIVHGFSFSNECSILSLQLHVSENRIGKLVIKKKERNQYTKEHAILLEMIMEPIAIALSNAIQYKELVRVKKRLEEDNLALSIDLMHVSGTEIIGADLGLKDVMAQVRQISQSTSPALLLGETGTGKEVIAKAIHMASPRYKGPMISMQCGAVPENLMDSELFGHEKGAFTGAFERKVGRFERANKGTLFIDEVGELSLSAQVKFLRVLQEKRFERVGGTKEVKVDVRVIAATHRNLEQMIKEGTFREDLWYRLNVLPLSIPPLRLRKEDIPSLVQYFITCKTKEMNRPTTPRVDDFSLERLKTYDWPGNVRELQNIVERALIQSQNGRLTFPELGSSPCATKAEGNELRQDSLLPMNNVIMDHIQRVLEHTRGRIEGKYGAAKILKMNPGTLRFRMKKLGIQRKHFQLLS